MPSGRPVKEYVLFELKGISVAVYPSFLDWYSLYFLIVSVYTLMNLCCIVSMDILCFL